MNTEKIGFRFPVRIAGDEEPPVEVCNALNEEEIEKAWIDAFARGDGDGVWVLMTTQKLPENPIFISDHLETFGWALTIAAGNNDLKIINQIFSLTGNRINGCYLGLAITAAKRTSDQAALVALRQYSAALPERGLHRCMQYYGENRRKMDLLAVGITVAVLAISTLGGLIGIMQREK